MAIEVSAIQPVAGLQLAGGVSTSLKVWNGSEWVGKILKWWNGAEWVIKPLKYWNGSEWIAVGGGSGGVVTDSQTVQLQTDVVATEPGESVSINVQGEITGQNALVELLDITLRVTPAAPQSISGVDVKQHITEAETVQLQTDVVATEPGESVSVSVGGEVTGSASVTLS